MNMLLHATTPRLERSHGSDDWLATSAAKSLARLYRGAASIAEHKFLPWGLADYYIPLNR
jgi:hypothetical protein